MFEPTKIEHMALKSHGLELGLELDFPFVIL